MATQKFLREEQAVVERDAAVALALQQEEQDAQDRLRAGLFAPPPNVVNPAAAGGGNDLEAALNASFEQTRDEAGEKFTVFPVPSSAPNAGLFNVNAKVLLNAVYELTDETEEENEGEDKLVCISGAIWKITNHGEFTGNFAGNADYESSIEPTAVNKLSEKNGLIQLTYTFKKADGALVELKLEYVSPKPKKNP